MLPATLRMPTAAARELARELRPQHAAPDRRRRLAPLLALAAVAALAAAVALRGHEFTQAIERALHAGWWTVAVGAACEVASLAGYVLLLHHVVGRGSVRLRRRDSYDIALGGTAATRLLPTAGLGGIAVAAWALRARGMRPHELTERLLAFLLLLYGVYALGLLCGGAAVAFGLVPVSHGQTLGLIAIALAVGVVATVVIVFARPAPVRA